MKKYVCGVCGYVYEEAKGIPEAGIAPGTRWEELPADWKCPLCGAPKSEFRESEETAKVQAATENASGRRTTAPLQSSADLKELSTLEMSVLCSNLSRGCEKQYKMEEAAFFTELAQYFKKSAGTEQEPDMKRLLELIDQDLDANLPEARAAAAGAQPKDRGALRALTWSEKVTRIQKSLVERWQKEGVSMLENTGVWVCTICGFIYIGANPPELCPICKVPGWKFEKVEGRVQ